MFKILSNEKLKEQYLKHYTNGFADGQKNEIAKTKEYKKGYDFVHNQLDDECLVNLKLKEENQDLKRENENLTKSIDRYRQRHNVTRQKHDNDVQGLLDIQSRLIEEKEDMHKELERILGDRDYWMEESRKKEHHAYSKLCFNITLAKKYEWIAKKTKKARIREKAMKKLLEV